MSKFMDSRAMISWFLSQIALLLSIGILIVSIAGIAFYNDWQREAEARALALNFASLIASVDLMEYSGMEKYVLPPSFTLYFSEEYIKVETEGEFRKISISIPFFAKPIMGNLMPWKNSTRFHENLFAEYGYYGSIGNPFPDDYRKEIENYMARAKANMDSISMNPFVARREIFIEKDFIYFENGKIPLLFIWVRENDMEG